MTDSSAKAVNEDSTEYTHICPICGYTNDSRLSAAQHLVDGHMMCVTVEEAMDASGKPSKFGNQWKQSVDLEELEQ